MPIVTFISAQPVISSQVWFGSSRLKLTSYQVRTDAVFSQTLSVVIVEFSKTQHFSDKSDMLTKDKVLRAYNCASLQTMYQKRTQTIYFG